MEKPIDCEECKFYVLCGSNDYPMEFCLYYDEELDSLEPCNYGVKKDLIKR